MRIFRFFCSRLPVATSSTLERSSGTNPTSSCCDKYENTRDTNTNCVPFLSVLPNTKNITWNSCQISDNSIQSFSSLSVWLTRLLKRQSGLVICMRAVRNGHRGNWGNWGNWANNWVFVPPCAQQSEKVMPRRNWVWNVDRSWLYILGSTALHFTH